jgi:hypothetical protein
LAKRTAPIALLDHLNELMRGNSGDYDIDRYIVCNDDSGLHAKQSAALDKAIEAANTLVQFTVCPNCDADFTPTEPDLYLDHLLQERDEALAEADGYAVQIAKIYRLGNPDFMGEAYDLLADAITDQKTWRKFINASLDAEKDYDRYRQLGKEAARLSDEISMRAKELARLVRDLRDTGLRLPEILSVETKDGPIDIWGAAEKRNLKIRRFMLTLRDRGKSKEAAGQVDIRDLLVKVSQATENFTADFMDPSIHSALSTRQHSRKTTYLRAFGTLLLAQRIPLTPAVKRAMAITANTIMNEPALDFSEDNVRKALSKMGYRGRKKLSERTTGRQFRKTR